MDPNIHDTLKPRRGTRRHPTFTLIQKRLTAIADKYSLDMQNVRFQLILGLKALAEIAQQKAIDTHPGKEETKQNWIRLAAYIGQVINGIGKTYEEIKTDEDLKNSKASSKNSNKRKHKNHNNSDRRVSCNIICIARAASFAKSCGMNHYEYSEKDLPFVNSFSVR